MLHVLPWVLSWLTVIQFSAIVISGFGFTELQTYLINIPLGVAHGCFALSSTYLCGRFTGYRTVIAAGLAIIRYVCH